MTDIETPPPPSTPWWRSILLAVVAGLLIVAVGVTAVVLLNRHDSRDTSSSAAGTTGDDSSSELVPAAALVAARQEATNFFSLDYRHPEDDIAAVLALATGKFKSEYDANRTSVIAQVKEKKLVSTAAIPQDGVAVEFANGKEARILVVVDVTRTIGTTTDTLRNRARMLMLKVGDHWLVSGVNQVG